MGDNAAAAAGPVYCEARHDLRRQGGSVSDLKSMHPMIVVRPGARSGEDGYGVHSSPTGRSGSHLLAAGDALVKPGL